MVDGSFEHHWDRLIFRDYLIAHPVVARQYGDLKQRLALNHHCDRVAYTKAKTDFITRVTSLAKAQRDEACRQP